MRGRECNDTVLAFKRKKYTELQSLLANKGFLKGSLRWEVNEGQTIQSE